MVISTIKIREYAEKLFQIHRKDWNKVLYLSTLNFMLFVSATIGLSGTTTLFLKKFGVDNLPYMYIIYAVLTSVCTVFYITFGSKIPKKSVIWVSALAAGFFVLLIKFWLDMSDSPVIYAVLYVFAMYIWWIFYSQFWSYAVEICSVREGKRIFSLIVCAGLFGGIAGGIITQYTVMWLHTKNLLLIWVISMFVILLFIKRVKPPITKGSAGDDEQVPEEVVIDKEHIKSDLVNAFNFLYNSKLVRILTLTFLLYGLGVYLLDYHFNKVMDMTYQSEDKLAAFYGTYAMVFYAVTLITELFMSNRILKLIGVGSVMMLLPGTLMIGFSMLSFWFIYSVALGTKFARDVIGNSLIESTYPLLFTPIVRQYRAITVAFIEGLVIPAGIALSGIFLIVLIKVFSSTQLCLIAAAVSLLWLYLTIVLRKEYIRTFIENITVRSYRDKSFLQEHYVSLDEMNIYQNLQTALIDPNEKVQEVAIEFLGKTKDPRAAQLLADHILLVDPKEHIKSKIIKILGEMKAVNTAPVIKQFLTYGDSRVRANAVEALGEMNLPDIKELVTPLLNDSNPRTRINAEIILWRQDTSEAGLKPLIESFNSPDEITRVRTVYALGRVGGEKAKGLLVKALNDTSTKVQLHAVRGLGHLNDPSVVIQLIKMLGSKKRNLRRQVRNILLNMDNIVNDLINALSDPNRVIREQTALILAERKEEINNDPILKYCEHEIESVYRDDIRINLMTTQNSKSYNFLVDSLKKRNERTVMRVLRIISILENSEFLSLAIRRLRDKDEKMRDSVLEVMDTLSYGKILKLIIPLLDEKSEADRNIVIQQNYKKYIIPSVKNILKDLLDDEEEWIRICGIYTLGELKEIDLIPELMELMENESEYVREAVIEALGKIGTVRARVALKEKVYDDAPRVRNVIERYITSAINPGTVSF
jgi:AAA family ATP:ADP antiporter